METFGSRIKECRKAKGLTQDGLGKITGMSAQKISNIERSYTTGLGVDDIVLLSKALNVSSEYLIENVRNPDAEIAALQVGAKPVSEALQLGDAGLAIKGLMEKQAEDLFSLVDGASFEEGAAVFGVVKDSMRVAERYRALDTPGREAVMTAIGEQERRAEKKAAVRSGTAG